MALGRVSYLILAVESKRFLQWNTESSLDIFFLDLRARLSWLKLLAEKTGLYLTENDSVFPVAQMSEILTYFVASLSVFFFRSESLLQANLLCQVECTCTLSQSEYTSLVPRRSLIDLARNFVPHMHKFRHFWRKKKIHPKSHLAQSCTKPFSSALRQLKNYQMFWNYLRITIKQDRLNKRLLMHCHKSINTDAL